MSSILELRPHPDFPTRAVQSIDVEVAKSEYGQLVLHYRLTGNLEAISLPTWVQYASLGDRLWEQTCFEAFARISEGEQYMELNFAPSTAWAAYGFDGYRAGMRPLLLDPPPIDVEIEDGRLDLYSAVDVVPVEFLQMSAAWEIGLSAIIEESDGIKSYWALAHGAGPPDFHNPACFAYILPPFEPE